MTCSEAIRRLGRDRAEGVGEMNVICYRLEPIAEQWGHPDWAASPFYEICWVTAYSEEDARRLVMDATLSFVDRDENSETLYSP